MTGATLSSTDQISPLFKAIGKNCAVPVVRAVKHIRRMRGGSQAQLMRCSDGHFYVVKFANNPQGTRILVNEFLAHGIARELELPIPPCAIVDVSAKLIELTQELVIEGPRLRVPCESGLAFGSRWAGQRGPYLSAMDFVPSECLPRVTNLQDFLGMLVFDKWTCNTDGRQVVFSHASNEYHAYMIDNGFCFNSGDWNFPDSPARGLYADRYSGVISTLYRGADRLSVYEPWLSRIENQWEPSIILEYARQIPPEWYGFDEAKLNALLSSLDRRRARVRELVLETLRYMRAKYLATDPIKALQTSVPKVDRVAGLGNLQSLQLGTKNGRQRSVRERPC